MATKTRLTVREQKFVEDYAATGNATEAAMKNYNPTTRESAQVMGSNVLARPRVQDAIAAKVRGIKEGAATAMGDGLKAAIEQAKEEMTTSEEAADRDRARRFLLNCAKFLEEDKTKEDADVASLKNLFPHRN